MFRQACTGQARQAAGGRAPVQRHSRREPAQGRPGTAASAPGASLAAKINAQSAAKLGTGGLQPTSQPVKAEGADQAAGMVVDAEAADVDAVDQAGQAAARAASVASVKTADQDGAATHQPPSAQTAAPATDASQGGGRGPTDADLDAALAASAMDADGWQIMPGAPSGNGGCGDGGDKAADDCRVGAAAAGAQPSDTTAASAALPAAAATPAARAGEHSLSSADTQPLSEAIRFLEDIGAVSSPPHSSRKRGRRAAAGGAAAGAKGISNSEGGGAGAAPSGLAAAPATAPASAGAGRSEGDDAAPMEVDLPAARQQPPDCTDLATEPRPVDPATESAPVSDSGRPGSGGSAAGSGSRDNSRRGTQLPAPDSAGAAASAAEDSRRPEPPTAGSVAAATGQAPAAAAATAQQREAAAGSGAVSETAQGSGASGSCYQAGRRGGGDAAGLPSAAARSCPAPAEGGEGNVPGPETQDDGSGGDAAGPSNPALSELLGVMGDGVSREDVRPCVSSASCCIMQHLNAAQLAGDVGKLA